jgi:hypothetical protein
MQVKYQIIVQLDDSGAGEFVNKYQAHRLDDTSIFMFEDKTTACEAVETANKNNLEQRLFYIYQIQPEETSAHNGFYFVPQTLDNIWQQGELDVAAIEDLDIVEDFSTEFIFVNERMKHLLDKFCLDVETAIVVRNNKDVWYRVEKISTLPEPIYIPHPVFLSPNLFPLDTFAVQSDGRDILTKNNESWIEAHGVALSNEAETPLGKIKWRPRIIASGKLMAQTQIEQIKGIEDSLTVLVSSIEDDCSELPDDFECPD